MELNGTLIDNIILGFSDSQCTFSKNNSQIVSTAV